MDNKPCVSHMMLAGYIRSIRKSLSPPLNIIPQEIFSMISCYSTNSYDGEYEWNIDPKLMHKMFKCGSKDYFISPQFHIGGMDWHLYAYPNGSNRHDKGIFKLSLEPVSMPSKWHKISVFSRYTCVQNQSSDASIFTFKRSKFHRFYGTESWHKQYSSDPAIISLDDIKNRNTNQLTFKISIKILQILSNQNRILYQTQLKTQLNKLQLFQWKIDAKLLKEIKYSNSYPMKCLISKKILNDMWCLKLFVQTSTNTIGIGLQLCVLPSNIDSVRVKWSITFRNTQFISTQKDFDYKCSFDCLQTKLSYLENNNYLTYRINIIDQRKSELIIDANTNTLKMNDEMTNIYTMNVKHVKSVSNMKNKKKQNDNCEVLRKEMKIIAMNYHKFTLGNFSKMYATIFDEKIKSKYFGSLKHLVLYFSDMFTMKYERSVNKWHITSKIAVKQPISNTKRVNVNKLQMKKLTLAMEGMSKDIETLRTGKAMDERYIQYLKQEIVELKQKLNTQNTILNTKISKMRQDVRNKDTEISKMRQQINKLTLRNTELLAQNEYTYCSENNDTNNNYNYSNYGTYSNHYNKRRNHKYKKYGGNERSQYYSYPQREYH